MQKRLRILLVGAFLLCVLVGGFFAFSHIAGPAHAASGDPYYLGEPDGVKTCRFEQGYNVSPIDRTNDFSGYEQSRYEQGWYTGYHAQGCRKDG